MSERKLAERNIPGMMNRASRFAEVEHAQNAGATLRRILTYFAREKAMVAAMLVVVIFGTLCGVFAPGEIGELYENCGIGVYGAFSELPKTGEMPVAIADEVKTGKAQIISTVDADGPQYYDIEITKIYTKSGQRNMIIEVRNKRLIEKTGGIVQGMSGSPIVHNGMLVGAVTHVFINDPLKGYAIFAQTMAEEAERISSPGYSAAS